VEGGYSQSSGEVPVDLNQRVSPSVESSLWFPTAGLDPHVRLRLFCFPYAGGSSQIFNVGRQTCLVRYKFVQRTCLDVVDGGRGRCTQTCWR